MPVRDSKPKYYTKLGAEVYPMPSGGEGVAEALVIPNFPSKIFL